MFIVIFNKLFLRFFRVPTTKSYLCISFRLAEGVDGITSRILKKKGIEPENSEKERHKTREFRKKGIEPDNSKKERYTAREFRKSKI